MANNKNRYFKKNTKKSEIEYVPTYDKNILDTNISIIGLNEPTLTLLSNGNILTVYDICKRTEKDMYKLQGFGKRNLLSIKASLTKLAVDFAPVVERPIIEKKPPIADGVIPPNKVVQPQEKRTPLRPNTTKRENITTPEKKDVRTFDNRRTRTNDRNNRNTDNKRVKNDKELLPILWSKPKKCPQSKPSVSNLPTMPRYTRYTIEGKTGWKLGKNIIIPAEYQEVGMIKEDMVLVELNEQFGYVDINNQMIVEPKYDLAFSFNEGLASICRNEKCGYIDKTGKEIIALVYDNASSFTDGIAKVRKDGRWGNLDRQTLEVTWLKN